MTCFMNVPQAGGWNIISKTVSNLIEKYHILQQYSSQPSVFLEEKEAIETFIFLTIISHR